MPRGSSEQGGHENCTAQGERQKAYSQRRIGSQGVVPSCRGYDRRSRPGSCSATPPTRPPYRETGSGQARRASLARANGALAIASALGGPERCQPAVQRLLNPAKAPQSPRPNTVAAERHEASATASTGSERAAATPAPTAGTQAGWLGRPRWGTGARNGESVSTISRPGGHRAAARRISSAAGKVTMPEKDRYAPRSSARLASPGPPVKQCRTRRSGGPSEPRMSKVSSQAERLWTTRARPWRTARPTWAAKASRWAGRGEWS